MKTLALLILPLLLLGCASVSHTRVVVGPDGKVISRETESAHQVLMKGSIDKLHSNTKDGTYSHSFSANGIQGAGDVEMLKTAIESTGTAVGNGMGAAAKAAVKP